MTLTLTAGECSCPLTASPDDGFKGKFEEIGVSGSWHSYNKLNPYQEKSKSLKVTLNLIPTLTLA